MPLFFYVSVKENLFMKCILYMVIPEFSNGN